MPEILERAVRLAQTAAERLHVRSALNPALWLCAISTPVCLLFAYTFRDVPEVRNWLIVAGLAPVGVSCLAFIGFAIFKPEKLQSEEYQIRHESLQLIQEKSGRIVVARASLEAIANPQAPALPFKGEDDA